jgi:hypothetical protein
MSRDDGGLLEAKGEGQLPLSPEGWYRGCEILDSQYDSTYLCYVMDL